MPELFDVYIDQIMVGLGPYGATINFLRTPPKPAAPGSMPQAEDVGTVRMSLEHLKVMVYMLRQQVNEAEGKLGFDIPVSYTVLNSLKIAPEDWDHFWGKEKE